MGFNCWTDSEPYNANHPICKIDSKKIIDFIGNLGKSEVLKSICEKNIDESKIYAILDDESEKKGTRGRRMFLF